MRSVLLGTLAIAAVSACGADTGRDGHAQQPDGGGKGDDLGGDAAPGCKLGPAIARQSLIDGSIAYLREAFGTAEDFDGGVTIYGEMWVALSDGGCPTADWSTLGYVAPIAAELVPLELRGGVDTVAAMWGLNGKKFIVYLDNDGGPGTSGAWQAGRLPDSVAALTGDTVDPLAVQTLRDQIVAQHPGLEVTWLSAVGALTIDAAIGDFVLGQPVDAYDTIPEIEAAVQQVRDSGLFDVIEWSGLNFRIPNEQRLVQVVDGDPLEPECLRRESSPLRDAGQFTTEPSLQAPLGDGPIARQATCE